MIRLQHLIPVALLRTLCVVVIGVGGGANLCRNLVRCGIGRLKIVDKDVVAPENICRQECMHDQIGQPKVHALGHELKRINPDVEITCHYRDFCTFSDEEIDSAFGDADLFIFCVDNLPANARGNQVALRLGKPAIFVGLYPQGCAAEIAFWRRGIESCYRCLCSHRYVAFEKGQANAVPSDGTDILAVQYVDSVAAMIALGLLTHGTDNRYSRLVDDLAERNFLQLKLDPSWRFRGRDIFREQLQIPDANDAYFSFVTIARRDPDPGGLCPDCLAYRSDSGSLFEPKIIGQ